MSDFKYFRVNHSKELANDNTVGGGYSPLQLGWLTIAGLSPSASQIRETIKEQLRKRNDQRKITLSRAHGSDELNSMISCQCYSIGYGTYEFGKQFWTRTTYAIKYGERFIKPRVHHYHVTSATISMRLYESIPQAGIFKGKHDNIGPAVTVPPEMLPAFNYEMNINGGFKLIGTFWDTNEL